MTNSANDTTVIAERRARAEKNDDYRHRRAVMLERAAFLFHTNGISETSVSDIAAAAGLDRATVYYYFPNKEAIVAEVVREAVMQSTTAVAAIASSNLEPVDKLRQMIIVSMQLFDRHYPHLFVYLREDMLRSVPEAFRKWLEETAQAAATLWRGVIEEGTAGGAFDTDLQVDALLSGVLGALTSVARWYRPESGLDPDTIGAGVARLLLDGLLSR
jgi:AcrR family transcriptional regulator